MGALFLGVLIIVIGGFAALWKLAVKSQLPKRLSVNTFPDIPYEDITILNGDFKLNGWFIPAKGKEDNNNIQNPLIILVHGWGSSRVRMKRYIYPIYEEGYSILMFDVRGHGDSDAYATPTVKTFRDDVVAAIQYARKRSDVDSSRIGILSHSFGAFGSVLANKNELGIKALVSDSMPVRFSTIMKASLKSYKIPYFPIGYILSRIVFIRSGITRKELRELDTCEALLQRKAPVLLIHSKNDDYIPSTELDFIIKNQRVDHLFVESIGHRSSETDPLFWDNVIPFFKKHMLNE